MLDAFPHDATQFAVKVIAAAGGTDPEKIRRAFFAQRYSGLLADLRFEPNGDANHQIHIVGDEKDAAKWVATVKFRPGLRARCGKTKIQL
jgi:ABC-type branched-subunit amino acid transport system substrate-binding protein